MRVIIFFTKIIALSIVIFIAINQVSSYLPGITGSFNKEVSKISNIYEKFSRDSCEKPLEYSLGSIDERFNLTEAEILSLLKDAEKVWESSIDKNLFVYNPDSDKGIVINFIFDERQESVIASNASEANLNKNWNVYNGLVTSYDSISLIYENEISKYDQNVLAYEDQLDKFNKIVKDWNNKPGSKKEFNQLKDAENELRDAYSQIEADRINLNTTVADLNKLSEEVNKVHKELNRRTDLHNSNFVNDEIVDSGDYGNYEINIYQFYSVPDLRLTLAHEMGHSLGIDHLENPDSIMYYLLEEQDVTDLQLSLEDREALAELCGI